jgi:hypothetical protein
VDCINVDKRKNCVMCKYWQGDAEKKFNPRTRLLRFDSNAKGACMMYGNQMRSAHSGIACPKFAKEYLYVQ